MRLAALTSAVLILAACGTDGDDVALRYPESPAARLSPAIVGQSLADALAQAEDMPTIREPLPGGGEVVGWTRANVNRADGEAIMCQERVTAAGGIVRTYDREGNAC